MMDAEQIRTALSEVCGRHISSLARIQLFAEIARVGYEHAMLAARMQPSKGVNKELADYILEQADDFYDLYQMIVVRLWSILEAFFSEVCLIAVQQIDWADPHERLRKIKCDLWEVLRSSKGELAELIVSKIEDQLGAPLKVGAGRFEAVLDVLGLGGAVNDQVRSTLFELSKYRHCVAHNDGIIDGDLVRGIPRHAPYVGHRLAIVGRVARQFLFASLWYVMEVQSRFLSKLGGTVPSEFRQEQERYAAWLSSCEIPESKMPFARADLTFAKSVPAGSTILVLGPADPPPPTP